MKLADLNVFPHRNGFQHKELFSNSYGISVIPEEDGSTYEVAVLQHSEGRHAHLCYTSEVTNDVVRYCNVDQVDELIERIKRLPSPSGD
jgi:hypothetical protein